MTGLARLVGNGTTYGQLISEPSAGRTGIEKAALKYASRSPCSGLKTYSFAAKQLHSHITTCMRSEKNGLPYVMNSKSGEG